ncbi:MAG: TatD family hydrolase [Ilumatobacteraceae bacterium]
MNDAGGYTDSHCHLWDTRGADVADVLAAARGAGVDTMVNVGCDAATSAAALAQAAAHEGVYATVGLHPHEAIHGVDSILPLLDSPGVVAIGECGLDYFYDHSPRDAQRAAFAAQVAIANERKLPLVIHTRDSWDDTFDVLTAEGVPERTVFHCFTGGPDELRRCVDIGAFVSFSGIVTFKTAGDLRAAAGLCPAGRLLAETDSPYLAPVPHRGRTNRPAYVTDVVARLAEVRGEEVEHVRATTTRNARLAFPALRT